MKTTNYIFCGLFSLLGVIALTGVLFFGAIWHLGTFAACALFAILFALDNKKQATNG